MDSQDKTPSVEVLKEAPPPAGKSAKPHGKALLLTEPPKSNPPVATTSAFLQNVSLF